MQELLFARDGFVHVPEVLQSAECEAIAAQVLPATAASGGTRSLLAQRWCRRFVERLRSHPVLCPLVPRELAAVQCTYFEKSADRNWLVPIHQDLSIPVAERVDHPALRGWSEKEEALFVQAPTELLQQLVAVRLHHDPSGPEDGPLRVVPGTHLQGRIKPGAAVAVRASAEEVVCQAEPGSALVLRPLLLHASSRASGASRRRVLHFLFGPRRLPYGLRWQQVV